MGGGERMEVGRVVERDRVRLTCEAERDAEHVTGLGSKGEG